MLNLPSHPCGAFVINSNVMDSKWNKESTLVSEKIYCMNVDDCVFCFFQGLASESDREGISLGNYTYNKAGHPIQLFPVQVSLISSPCR